MPKRREPRKREQRRPTAAERDERVILPLPADKAIEALMATGPHPDDDEPGKAQP